MRLVLNIIWLVFGGLWLAFGKDIVAVDDREPMKVPA
jgi:uncharacterized membrane protein YccF (DUF307 family)